MSGRPSPRISIGLPVYNGEAQLPSALESLLAQSFEDFEIVISDNHSTDATEAICRDFAGRDPRIRYVRSGRNRGVAWNFNRAFELSRGQYFKWASSNDFHDALFLRRCLDIMELNSGCVLAYSRTRIIDERGVVMQDYEDNLDLPWPEAPRRFREYLVRVGLCNALFGLMRPEVLRRTGKLGNYPGSDIVLLGELTLYGTFVEVPEYLFHRRFEHASAIRNASLENWQEFFDPLRRGKRFMRTWRHQYEYLMADLRSPLSFTEKARVAATIARVCIAVRHALAQELTGAVRPRPPGAPSPDPHEQYPPELRKGVKPARRIGILGHVGNGNLGDEAIIEALIRGVRAAVPGAEFTAFTIRPADTDARHGISSFPLRRGLDRVRTSVSAVRAEENRAAGNSRSEPRSSGMHEALRGIPGLGSLLSLAARMTRWLGEMAREAAFWTVRYRRMRRVDLLIVAGSNQLSDYFGGQWGFPYTIWAWSVAARLAGARVAFLSVGAGPIRTPLSRLLIRNALSLASYRSYRDVGSRAAIAGIGIPGPHVIAPDLAHGLRVVSPPRGHAPAGAGPLIVINPLPYFDPRHWAERDNAVYRRFIDTLAAFTVTLRQRGYRVQFAPTQLRADPPVIADILLAMQGGSPLEASLAPVVTTFEGLVALLSAADYVIATRFHGVLLAQLLGRPTIGIVYRRSTRDLLVDVGQGAYAMDIQELTSEALLERLAALERDGQAGERIQQRLEQYREALAAQYAELLGTKGPGGAPET